MTKIHLYAIWLAFTLAAPGAAVASDAFEGRVVNAITGAPIAGAEVSIIGLAGSVRTDADGRFSWSPEPQPPFLVLIILPAGQVAKPVYVEAVDFAAVLTLRAEATVSEEVTVSGIAPSIDASPGAGLTLVPGIELQRRAPANLTQALENVPGVSQVSEGQAAVPAVRGLARGRTLIMIDGSRVSSERRVGPSATFLDPGSIEAIDVARGPGSVAYGSDAFGGVISVRTKRPDMTGPLRVRLAGTVGAGIPERHGEVEVSKGFGTGGLLALARYRTTDDYRDPNGTVFNSGFSNAGALLRGERRMGGGLLSVSWQGDFGSDVERPRSNSRTVRFYYPYENSHRVTGTWEQAGVGGFGQIRVTTFFGSYDQRTDQDRFATSTSPRSIERADIAAKDFQVRATAERAVGDVRVELGVDVNGRFGLEAHDIGVSFDLAGRQTALVDNLSIDSARRTDTGLYVQMDRPVGDWVKASGGVRVSFVSNVNTGGFFGNRSVSNQAVAGFGAVTVGPFEGVTMTAQLTRGFRDPTLSDRFYRGPTGRGFITGNPDLEPETSLQADLGVRYATGRVRLAGYFYHYRISDLVERYEDETDFFFFRNRGRARLRGVEVEMQADLGGGYSLELSGQLASGRALDDDTALDDVAARTVSGIVRRSVGERWNAHVRLAVVAEDDTPGPSEIVTPGYVMLDAGVGWRPTARLELRGAGKNLLNQEHYASPDRRFVLAPGASVSLAAVVRF